MKWFLCVVLLTGVTLFAANFSKGQSTAEQNGSAVTVKMGSQTLTLLAPDEFHDISTPLPQHIQFMQSLVPKGHDLLACFMTRAGIRALDASYRTDVPAPFQRVLLVSTVSTTRDRRITLDEMAKIKMSVRQNQNLHVEQAQAVEERTLANFGLTNVLGKIQAFGVYDETPSSITIGRGTTLAMPASEPTFVIEALTLCIVRDRLLRLSCTSAVKTEEDILWVKNTSRKWLNFLRATSGE